MTKHLVGVLLAGFLAWEYQPHPELALFAIFFHRPGHDYLWNWPKVHNDQDQPVVTIPALTELVLELDCRTLTLPDAGPWSSRIKAMGKDGQWSAPSAEEVVFYWSPQEGCTSTGQPPTTPPPFEPLPYPPPPPFRGIPVLPPMPGPPPMVVVIPPRPSGSDRPTDHPMWHGVPTTDAGQPSGGRPTDHPMWRGTGR